MNILPNHRLSRLLHSLRLSRDSHGLYTLHTLAGSGPTITGRKVSYNGGIFSVVDHLVLIFKSTGHLKAAILDRHGRILARVTEQPRTGLTAIDVDKPFRVEIADPVTGELWLTIKRPQLMLTGRAEVYLPGIDLQGKPVLMQLGKCEQSFSYINRVYQLATLEDRKRDKYRAFGEVLAIPHQDRFEFFGTSKRLLDSHLALVDSAPLGVRLKHSFVFELDLVLSSDQKLVVMAAALCLRYDYLLSVPNSIPNDTPAPMSADQLPDISPATPRT